MKNETKKNMSNDLSTTLYGHIAPAFVFKYRIYFHRRSNYFDNKSH